MLNPGAQIFALIVRNITVATWARRLNKNQSIDRGAKWALKIYRILRAMNVMTNVSCWLEESQSCSGMGLNVAKLLQAQRCIVANFCSVCIPKASSQLLLITVHCGYTFLYIGKHVETYWYSQTCFSFSVRMCVTPAIPMQNWNASSWCSYFWIVLWRWQWQHSYTKSRSFLLEEDMWFALKLVQFARKDSASGSFAISTTTAFTRWTTPNTWWSRWKQIRHCDI